MAISWGPWQYAQGNGMRVGIEASITAVNHASTSATVTYNIYTENQYLYQDNQVLAVAGSVDYADISYYNGSGGGVVHRGTRTFTYNFLSTDYGSTPISVLLEAQVSGAYNGVTPKHSLWAYIPNRPYALPNYPTGVVARRVSDSQATLTWDFYTWPGGPVTGVHIDRWDNVTNSWTRVADLGAVKSFTDTKLVNARRYQYRALASGPGGYSQWAYFAEALVQTSPLAATFPRATKLSPTSISVSWNNGASIAGGYEFDTLVEERVDSGAWTQVASVGSDRTSITRDGRSSGSVYMYRVRHRSQIGGVTYSAYATSPSIQLQAAPTAPTLGSVVRTSDNRFTISWTNNPNGTTAPYEGITVQRFDAATSAWNTIATLGATATQFVDTGTITNRRYQWRVAANNAAGTSPWTTFNAWQTKPDAPSALEIKAEPGATLRFNWKNNTTYSAYTTQLQVYKDGVASGAPITIATGTSTYVLTGVTATSKYRFEARTFSTVGYSSQSDAATSIEVPAASIPNAPGDLSPSASVRDLKLPTALTWKHVPTLDGAAQTKFEIRHSNDGTTWVTVPVVTSSASSWTLPANTYTNGDLVRWQVRSWGAHATASAWSPIAQFTTSTTPVVTLVKPASGTVTISRLDIEWSFLDTEDKTVQSGWEVELYDADDVQLEKRSGFNVTTKVTLSTTAINGKTYRLRVRVQDSAGLWSSWVQQIFLVNYALPAVPALAVDYSSESGSTVISLTPKLATGGLLPASTVDVQRRIIVPRTGEFGEWETLLAGIAPDATLVDTTAPIIQDGQYRIVAHSEAPSTDTSTPQEPASAEDRWVYVSGGPNFENVCRLMGNVTIRTTTARERALYQFAGRSKPVMFASQDRSRIVDVAALLDGESSRPPEWEALIRDSDVILFRDPLGNRIYGSIPEVAIDYLGGDLYSIAFTVTEVDSP